jgi:hypothetical protein
MPRVYWSFILLIAFPIWHLLLGGGSHVVTVLKAVIIFAFHVTNLSLPYPQRKESVLPYFLGI